MERLSQGPGDLESRDETDRAAPLAPDAVRAARDAKKLAKQQAKKNLQKNEREEPLTVAAAKDPSKKPVANESSKKTAVKEPLKSKGISQSKAGQRAPGPIPVSETGKPKSNQPIQNLSNIENVKLKFDTSLETAQRDKRKSLNSGTLIEEKKTSTSATDIAKCDQPEQKIDAPCKIDPTQKAEPAFSAASEKTKSKAELRAERRAQQVAQKAAKKDAQPQSAESEKSKAPPPSQLTHEDTAQSEKSKAQMRAERRAIQEAQRAAKATVKPAAAPAKAAAVTAPAKIAAAKPSTPTKSAAVAAAKPKATTKPCAGASWFRHLETPRPPHAHINGRAHPAAVRLAAQMCARVVRGSNARVVALLHALQQVVADYTVPARTDVARGLESALAACLAPVWAARPPAASMVNAVKHLRALLAHLPNNISEFDAKCQIKEAIDTYLREQIEVAGDAISLAVRAKISTGDLVLTYGCSSLVEKILVEAWRAGVQFRVVVVGARHNPAGRVMLRRLVACGVRATYVDLAALGWAMRRADKVVVGAGALLANGWVLAAAGTACVAVAARAHNAPVLVACETHKFSERVQTDAFVYNEVERVQRGRLALAYDVTPPALVAAVVTELAVLPCTSAPVVLRFKLGEYAV